MGIQSGLIYKEKNINYFYPNNEGIIFGKKIFTDGYGFRVPSKNFKYKDTDNIFILGDSVTFGNGIKEEATFIGLLRAKLKDKEIINSSVPGYQISDQVNIINQTKKFNNINQILYFFTLNDIYGSSNIQNIKKQEKESDFSLKEIKLLNKLNAQLRNKSYLYMLVKGLGTDPSKRWFLNLYNKYENQNFNQIKNQFIYLKKFSDNLNIDFKVILLPYEYQTRKCSKNIFKPQNMIKKILKDSNIFFLDLSEDFCKQIEPKKKFYKFDPMHLSEDGHTLVYNSLINEINF